MNLYFPVARAWRFRVVGAIIVTGLITWLASHAHAAQTIPGVDVIIRKTPGGTAITFDGSAIPAGTVDPLNDFDVPTPLFAAISTTRSNTKGGLSVVGGSPPIHHGGGNWTVDSFFDITYQIDFEDGDGNLIPFDGSGLGQIVGPGVTNFDRDGDGDVDLEDDLLSFLEGPIHQFDVELVALSLADPISGWLLRESPTEVSIAQILRRDLPNGQYMVASFFDIFFELSLDGGQTWLPAASSAQFMTVPEPSAVLLLGMGLAGMATMRRIKRKVK